MRVARALVSLIKLLPLARSKDGRPAKPPQMGPDRIRTRGLSRSSVRRPGSISGLPILPDRYRSAGRSAADGAGSQGRPPGRPQTRTRARQPPSEPAARPARAVPVGASPNWKIFEFPGDVPGNLTSFWPVQGLGRTLTKRKRPTRLRNAKPPEGGQEQRRPGWGTNRCFSFMDFTYRRGVRAGEGGGRPWLGGQGFNKVA